MKLQVFGQPARSEFRPNGPAGLPEETLPVLEQLWIAVVDLVAGIPVPIKRSEDLRKAMDVDKALGWKVYRISSASDALSAAQFIPSSAMMRRFLQVARDKGIAQDRVDRAAEAFSAFEEFVRSHATDRTAFNAMIRGVIDPDSDKDDLKNKRDAFRINKQIFGLHADAVLSSTIARPSAIGTGYDVATIFGGVRVQRTRAHTSLLNEIVLRIGAPCAGRANTPEPLERTGDVMEQAGLSLLHPFCSEPLPNFKTFFDQSGKLVVQTHCHSLGNKGAATYFMGGLSRNAWSEHLHHNTHNLRSIIATPTEAYVRDIWLHKSMWPSTKPVVEVYWQSGGFDIEQDVRESGRLPITESIIEIQQAHRAGVTPEFPPYLDMVRHVADKLTWNLEDFRLFRCRVEYPIMGSMLRLRFPITPSSSTIPE